MKISEVPIPKYESEYDDVFAALISAWKKGAAIKIETATHPQSIRAALKRRLADDPSTRDLCLTVNVNDDGCTVYIDKEMCQPKEHVA